MVFLCRFSFFSLELSTQKTPGLVTKVGGRFIHIRIVMDGERDRIRTCDPVIKSHLLYQLSYAPELSFVKRQVTFGDTQPLDLFLPKA